MKLWILFLTMLAAFTTATNREKQVAANTKPVITDITMSDHAVLADIRFIYFTPDQVLDKEKEIFIICKTTRRGSKPPQRMSDIDYFCFSSMETWDVEVTNASTVQCVMDDFAGSEVVRVANPVRDHSCTIAPVFATATEGDRERMLSYLKDSNWVCDHIDCLHNNITMFEILDHSLKFEDSQFILGNQHPRLKLISDMVHFIKDL